ncbi:hypothetical protein M433DRAFT_550731, partial [Acidomyces richmondensis BFW]
NVGASAVIGALRSGHNVLATVRNKASAEKLFQNIETQKGIHAAECIILLDQSVQNIVDQVREGKLPGFQHVYACGESELSLSNNELLENFRVNFEPNFFAYRAVVPCLMSRRIQIIPGLFVRVHNEI